MQDIGQDSYYTKIQKSEQNSWSCKAVWLKSTFICGKSYSICTQAKFKTFQKASSQALPTETPHKHTLVPNTHFLEVYVNSTILQILPIKTDNRLLSKNVNCTQLTTAINRYAAHAAC